MRALLSVYDKAGIVEFAEGLADLGWELVSSGGTAAALRDAGLEVVDTADITGFPAILGHRVVTLHPRVHGGILADRTDPAHRADLEAHGIEPFDLVVVNLYPFGAEPSAFEHGATRAEELIDIGGPTLVRAAAKNHAQVGVVVDPAGLPGRARRAPDAGSLSRHDTPRARPDGLRPHRRVRRGHRRLVRRRHRFGGGRAAAARSTSPTGASRSPCATGRTPTSGRRSTAPSRPAPAAASRGGRR